MNRKAMTRWIALGAAWAVLSGAWAADLSKFRLGQAVPADVTMVALSRNHDGKEFVNEQWARVWDRLERAKLENNIRAYLRSQLQQQGGDVEQFNADWNEINDLLQSVDWGRLTEREGAFAVRLTMPPEILIMCLPAPEAVESNFKALKGLLTRVAKADATMELVETEQEQTEVATLQSAVGIGLTLARHQDTLMIAFGGQIAAEAVDLMAGSGEPIVKAERFQQAFNGLPAAEDGLWYVDGKLLIQQIGTLAEAATAMAGGAGGDLQQARAFNAALLDGLAFFDRVASVSTTDGLTKKSHMVSYLTPDAESKRFYEPFFGVDPLAEPAAHLPKSAGDVTATTGMDLQATYDAILSLVREHAPDGAAAVERFKSESSQIPVGNVTLSLEEILKTVAGPIRYFSIPGPGRFSPTEWGILIEVRDGQTETAQQLIEGLATLARGMVEGQQGATLVETDINGNSFYTLQMPMLTMFLQSQPTMGLADGQLIIGSGPNPIQTSLAADSAAARFVSNERFKAEGLPLEGEVLAFSFQDTSQTGENLAAALQMVPMISMMAGPDLANDPGAQLIIGLLGKLGPVAREMNFFKSAASVTTREGRQLVARSVVNYQRPAKPGEAEPESAAQANP